MVVKTFEMLEDHTRLAISRDACLNLARATSLEPDLRRKIREFITDHLVPARFENIGRELAYRQEKLQQTLTNVLKKSERNIRAQEVATIPIDPQLLQEDQQRMASGPQQAFAPSPAPHRGLPQMDGMSNNNIFHTYATARTLSNRDTSDLGQGTSQLEALYAQDGAQAVRDLLELDQDESADGGRRKGQRGRTKEDKLQQMEEWICLDLKERFGGEWTAARWGGKGAPMREYSERQ